MDISGLFLILLIGIAVLVVLYDLDCEVAVEEVLEEAVAGG